jgi:uncharacterized RDD family membrane protein YckC
VQRGWVVGASAAIVYDGIGLAGASRHAASCVGREPHPVLENACLGPLLFLALAYLTHLSVWWCALAGVLGSIGGAGAGADGRLDMRIARRYRSVADDTWWQYPVSYPVGSTNHLLTELDRSPYGSVRWRRPAARVIDLALLIGPVVWLFSAVPSQPPPNSGVDDWAFGVQILAVLASIVWFVVLWPLYEIVAVGVSGRTLGKWITGLCVVDEDSGRIRIGSLFGRTILVVGCFVVAFLAGLWCWFVYPPLAIVPAAALGLSQAIPALRGERTWLDSATGTDVIRCPRLTARR